MENKFEAITGRKYECELQHWHTKGIRKYNLIKVNEDDCSWRTVDDNSEISHDWTVISWIDLNL